MAVWTLSSAFRNVFLRLTTKGTEEVIGSSGGLAINEVGNMTSHPNIAMFRVTPVTL